MTTPWMYQFVGPTTVHLQHEFLLWLSVTLLTISSCSSQYRGNYLATPGDIIFLVLVSLWLGRNIWIKWLITSDISTHRSPAFGGVMSHWFSSHFLAGQYFDRPKDLQTVAKQVGTHHSDDARTHGATLSSFFLPSILYTWNAMSMQFCSFNPLPVAGRLFKKRGRRVASRIATKTRSNGIGHKLQKHDESSTAPSSSSRNLKGKGRVDRVSSSSSTPLSSSSHAGGNGMNVAINQVYLMWNKAWSNAPLQMVIPVTALLFFMWYIVVPPAEEEAMHALTMTTRNPTDTMDERETKPFGAYFRLTKPTWSQLIVGISCGGTLATICMYARVILPIPDLVAGTNVLKAVRNESKLHSVNTSSGKSRSKVQRESSDLPWAEQQKPIATENRFRLLCKIAGIKLVENLFVCAILPRTGLACRATGHCPEGASLLEMSKIYYPAGITSALRSDAVQQSAFSFNSSDRIASVMTIISTVVITWTLLMSQAATLNRSYLGIMGYIAGEWVVVDTTSDPDIAGVATNWDPRRRYKKGDLISQSYPTGGQSIYRATSNSPEGRPFDLYLRATHDIFRNELGHPATSQIIAFVSGVQFILVYSLIALIFVYQVLDYYYTSLLWTLAATLVAACGVSCPGLFNYREWNSIAEQINH